MEVKKCPVLRSTVQNTTTVQSNQIAAELNCHKNPKDLANELEQYLQDLITELGQLPPNATPSELTNSTYKAITSEIQNDFSKIHGIMNQIKQGATDPSNPNAWLYANIEQSTSFFHLEQVLNNSGGLLNKDINTFADALAVYSMDKPQQENVNNAINGIISQL